MGLFDDDQVPLDELKRRAFNLRWATLPPDTLALTAADPDFGVAREIRKAIVDYTASGVFSYGPPEGLPSFRETIARTMRQRRRMRCAFRHILPTNSAASAMFVTAKFALAPGDEAIVFDPVDFLFAASVEAAGGKAVRVPMSATGGPDMDALRAAITPRTRMIGVCNPHNPLGRVMREDELTRIGRLAVEHDLWIMSDEIWSDIVFDGRPFVSMASLHPAIAQKTISVYGFSKTFGLAGLRVGFLVSPNDEVHEALVETSKARTTAFGVSTLSQIAAQAAYEHCWYWVEEFLKHLQAQRDLAVDRLNSMPGLSCHKPEGCYLLFPDIRETGKTAAELTTYLLEEARVAVVPGEAKWFGPAAEGHIRICFSTSHGILTEALDRIEEALTRM